MSTNMDLDNSISLLTDLNFEKPNVMYQHLHDSFNQVFTDYIPLILKKNDPTGVLFSEKITKKHHIQHKLKFDNVRFYPPMMSNDEGYMFPYNAQINNLIYSCKVIADITQYEEIIDNATEEKQIIKKEYEQNVPFGYVPVMLRSNLCNLTLYKNHPDAKYCKYDAGGYFIINGNEKVILSLEKIVENKILVFSKKEQNISLFVCEVFSKNIENPLSNTQTITLKLKKQTDILMSISTRKDIKELSVFLFIKALGMTKDRDIINFIVQNDTDKTMIDEAKILLENFVMSSKCYTHEDAINILSNNFKFKIINVDINNDLKEILKKRILNAFLSNDFMPHMTNEKYNPKENMINKAYFLCNMIKKLLQCKLNRIEPDERDSFINKRVETPGILIAQLFQQGFKSLLNECNKYFGFSKDGQVKNVIRKIKPTIIHQKIKLALSNGTWSKNKKGVAQVLHRTSYMEYISYLRKIITTSIDTDSNKSVGPRQLHNTHYGMICPSQTPEGEKTGIIKSLAMMSSISLFLPCQHKLILDYLENKIIKLKNMEKLDISKSKIFLSGIWLGVVDIDNIYTIYNDLKSMKMNNELERTISIVLKTFDNELHINCEHGRLYRPMLTVKKNKLMFKPDMMNKKYKDLNDFIIKNPGTIEYLDIDEFFYNGMIAYNHSILDISNEISNKNIDKLNKIEYNRFENVYVNYTHCEFHPSMILGNLTANIPLLNHNQAPRVIFQSSQAKHAMGWPISNYKHRMDNTYLLYHSEMPLVSTNASKYTNTEFLTAGQNCIVAIMSYTGLNQEDSLVINKSSVEAGLFRAASIKKFSEQIHKNASSGQNDIFKKPDPNETEQMKNGNYEKLNEFGYVPEETEIQDGDVIIGKISPLQSSGHNGGLYNKDNSVIYKNNIPATIDKVYHNITNADGYSLMKIRTRSERIPKIGDKFCSRSAQKGTCGLLLPREDMPFTKDGIVPDIIINPNALPKRMTVSQIIECIMGLIAVASGKIVDGTPFNNIDIAGLSEILKQYGFDETGNQELYNGFTGKKIEAKIFIGPVYYQRLKHMVDDKIFSRQGGQMQLLTRQPPDGRKKGGGLRLGEMERDGIIAHGLSLFLKERFVDSSDKYTMPICDKCGQIATKKKGINVYYCKPCNSRTHLSKITIPYAFKLFHQELKAFGIQTSLITDKALKAKNEL